MPSSSDHDLTTLLAQARDDITPSPAPVATVLRNAESMRKTRRISVLASFAVVVSCAVVAVILVPGLSHRPSAPVQNRRQVTLPDGAVVIGQGEIRGHRWRVVVNKPGTEVCAGTRRFPRSCQATAPLAKVHAPASLAGGSLMLPGFPMSTLEPVNVVYGTVGADVSRIAIQLSDGTTRSLRPVGAAGRRWVALVTPPFHPSIGRIVAYSGRSKLGSTVLFTQGGLSPWPLVTFVTWLRPGESGPARALQFLAVHGSPGFRHATALVDAGPWGYCLSLTTGRGHTQACLPVGYVRSGAKVLLRAGAPPAEPRWFIGIALPGVTNIVLTLSGAGTVTTSKIIDVITVSGQDFYAAEIGPGEHVESWRAVGANGNALYGGTGAPDISP